MLNQRSRQGVSIMTSLTLDNQSNTHQNTHNSYLEQITPCFSPSNCKHKCSQWQNPIKVINIHCRNDNYRHFYHFYIVVLQILDSGQF